MTEIGLQPATERGSKRSATQPSAASLSTPCSIGEGSSKGTGRTSCKKTLDASAGQTRVGFKGGAKVAVADVSAPQSSALAVTAIFPDLMAGLLPQAIVAQTAPVCGHAELTAVEGVHCEKPAGEPRKTKSSAAAATTKAEAMTDMTKVPEAATASKLKGELHAATPIPQGVARDAVENVVESGPVSARVVPAAPGVTESKGVSAVTEPPKASHTPETRGEVHWQGESKVFAATPAVLEVGLSAGTHGWLRVRAEVGNGGEITASLVTSSAREAEGLHHELPAISAFLASEQVGVSSVVVHAAERGAGAQDAAMNLGAGSHGRQERREQRDAPDWVWNAGLETTQNELRAATWADGWRGFAADPGVYTGGGGGWLSVRV